MDYTEVRFFNTPELNEVLIALMADLGFDMFEERVDGLNGYIKADQFDPAGITTILQSTETLSNIRFESALIKDRNWNSEWEKNFDPVVVADQVFIRAPFHETKNFPVEIIIEPKMSFGTGHHATTALMIMLMLETDFQGKKVLDMGCGSAVLAILAEKAGAAEILAIDFDHWAFENSIENAERNGCKKIVVKEGTAALLKGLRFEIILANINRNVLLADMDKYNESLEKGGSLMISGILKDDIPVMMERISTTGLQHQKTIEKDNWVAMLFKKVN